MEITQHCVVGLTWTLKDTLGEVLDELDSPVEFLVGGDDLLAKIEEALQGHSVGDHIDLQLEPEEAFGDYDENLVFLEARSLFPKELEEGHTVEGHALPTGCNPDAPQDLLYTVTELYPEHVVLDAALWVHAFSRLKLKRRVTICCTNSDYDSSHSSKRQIILHIKKQPAGCFLFGS
jgi:FKBP-type peptidyl-prolyl cis-trans isomerase SlyD